MKKRNLRGRKSGREQREDRDRVNKLQTLRWRLTLYVFGIMFLSFLLTALLYSLFYMVFPNKEIAALITTNPNFRMILQFVISAIIGTALAAWFGKYYLYPIKQLEKATREVKKGNFKVCVTTRNSKDSEMGILVENFNEMVRELDGIELFRNNFINDFSHEFKTPIVSIRGFAKELQFSDLTGEQRQEYARIIAEEADRLARLSTNVLELSKLEHQQILTDKTEFDLDEQLRRCIVLQESAWAEKEIEMIPELDPVRIVTNREMLAEVWSNLLANAIKFTPPCGTVTVTLKADDTNAVVTVSDTGVGMSPEVQAHIFEKFYQGDPSHHGTGYGIGLTMASKIVRLCGGTITVQSAPNAGSVFTVVLPLK